MLTLLTGPVRSGKSTFALRLAYASGLEPVYVATASVDPADPEMAERVARHRAERGAMRCVETDELAGLRLVDVVRAAPEGEVLIVDSLGTWLSSLLVAGGDDLEVRASELIGTLAAASAQVIMVAEEAGWGVVPAYPLGRAFRDRLGRLTATLAGRADRAYLVVAGFAVDLRAVGERISAS